MFLKFLKSLFAVATVESIVADFQKKVDQLVHHGNTCHAEASEHTEIANSIMATAAEKTVEGTRAHAIAEKIQSLLTT